MPSLPSDLAQQSDDPHWPASMIWRSGEPAVRKIGLGDLREALRLGVEDFKAAPTHVYFLCLIYPMIGLILFRLSFGYEILPLLYPLLTGCVLLGPFAAIGLYVMSKRREEGLDPSAQHAFEVLHSPSMGAILGLAVLFFGLFYGWMVVAKVIYVQSFGTVPPASVADFARQVMSTDAGHRLIVVGNGVGFLFAAFVFCVGVISFPLLVDRNVSIGTAMRASVRTVIENPLTMAAWGLLVVVALVLAALPFFFGLAIVFPVLGHATWHLYRRLIET
jgi:uncharacterized membrane protein